ncbi:MAG: SNF2-related protein, partial [Gammaproteobacteria bacterium]
MFKLKHDDIKACTDSGSFTRGSKYFNQHKVNNLYFNEIAPGEIILQSTVQGRSDFPYEQEINISGLLDGDVEINGGCSCPVAYNCKHVVAACLEYQSKPGKSNDVELNSLSWLEKFASAGLATDKADLSNSDFIVYTLQPSRNPTILSVQFMITRYLKKGGFGKPRQTDLYHFCNDYMQPGYAQDVDQEIGRLIGIQENHSHGYQSYLLSGELGFMALSKMLNTGRCYWQNINNPVLQHGEPRKLDINWQKQKNGDSRLALKINPDAKILNTKPPLYIDNHTAEIGPIHGADFNAEQWSMLLDAPVVPEKSSTKFSQQLVTRLPDLQLPTPQEMETVFIENVFPVPKLFIYAEFIPDTQHYFHMMRLRFTYHDHELTFIPKTKIRNIVKNNLILSIQRDLTAEQAAIDELYGSRFQLFPDEHHNDIILATPVEMNLMESMACWQDFIEQRLPELEAKGWSIKIDPDFNLEFLTVDDWEVEIDSDNDWFDLHFDLDIQGRKLPLLPLITDVIKNYDLDNLPENLILPISMVDGQFLKLASERIRPICQILYELYDSNTLDNDGKLRLGRFDATRLAELEESCSYELHWRGGKAMRELGRKLKDFNGIKNVSPPRGLKATLRDYQQQGLNWLQFLREYEFNGILADDMGLGKTVQTLAHLLLEKEKKRLDKPCLILAPTSLMSNWRREAAQFTPKLKVLILQGSQRHQYFSEIDQYDLIISTYPLLVRDHEILLAQEYHYLILDEAQVIKNPRAKAAQMARKVITRHRLCLTGTPMENHLGELWALFDFLMPGFLGDTKLFKQRFRTPIEKHGDAEQRLRLVRRISPFLLRRKKSEVITELPAKTEIIRSVALQSKQAALYESIRLSMEKKVRDVIAKKGLARSHITILDALLKLRQVCCDPQLLSLAQAKKVTESAKLEMLMEMLPELIEEGRRILLFSQFTKMLGIIEKKLTESNISYTKLTGQTRKRDEVIEIFRDGKVDVFLISLKAGGVGLNLTEADTVIHYDPWWNPAVETQATDRAHRIGQDKAVFVYKLITENTLEEKIITMQAKKQALADGVYNKNEQVEQQKLSANDL